MALLRVRPEQWEVFARRAREDFKRRLAAHLVEHWPERCSQLGRDGVGASIDTALERGAHHGIEHEYDILRYLNLMYALGFDLDSGTRYPWAQRILADRSLDPTSRIDLLSETAEAELRRQSTGPGS